MLKTAIIRANNVNTATITTTTTSTISSFFSTHFDLRNIFI